MWDIRGHLREWVNSKEDFVVVHTEGDREIRCGRVCKESRKAIGPNIQTVWKR